MSAFQEQQQEQSCIVTSFNDYKNVITLSEQEKIRALVAENIAKRKVQQDCVKQFR